MPLLYLDPATGTVLRQTSAFTPSIDTPSLTAHGIDLESRIPEAIMTVKGNSVEHIQRDMGLYWNAIFGDFHIAHGALEGRQTRLAAATVADTSTTINVDDDTDDYGDPLFAAGMFIAFISELPQSVFKHHQDLVTIDIAEIGAAYDYGVTAKTAIPIVGVGTAGAIGKAFAVGAFVQPILVLPGSMGINGQVGALASYERPSAVLALTATTTTTAQIDTITWTEHTQLRTDGYVVGGFDVYILKSGQGVCANGAPLGIKEHFIPSLENTLPVPATSLHTVSNETDYFDQTTNALTTIDTGIFYVVVVARTASDVAERVRYSPIAVTSVDVPA